MKSQPAVLKIKQLIPVIVTAIAVVIITGLFRWVAQKNYRQISASVALPTPTQQVSLQPQTSNLLPIAAAYQPQPITTSTKLPILMYHYIRDYNDTTDQIGVNLSVSPATFRQQLETLKQAGYTPITFQDLSHDLPTKPVILTFDDGYADAYTTAFPILKEQQMTAVFYLVSGFLNQDRYVTDAQAKELDAAGMEIGAHTVHHRNLSDMNTAGQRTELAESKNYLERLLGKPVTALCYPAGKYNQTTVSLAKELGYTTATTTKSGISTGSAIKNDPYELVRIRVTNGTDLLKVLGEKP